MKMRASSTCVMSSSFIRPLSSFGSRTTALGTGVEEHVDDQLAGVLGGVLVVVDIGHHLNLFVAAQDQGLVDGQIPQGDFLQRSEDDGRGQRKVFFAPVVTWS